MGSEKFGWRDRLREAIAAKKTNMKRLSVAAGLGETYVRDILERERDPGTDNARRIAKELGVPYVSIFGDEATGEEWQQVSAGGIVEHGGREYAELPIYDIRFAAGAGAQNYNEVPIDHYLMSMSVLRTMTDAPLSKIAGFQASGDSMSPSINDRDWCFADLRRTKLYNPGIYALVFEGEGLLKRAAQHLETGAVTLISDNEKYPAQTINTPDRLAVVGRVFMSIRRHG